MFTSVVVLTLQSLPVVAQELDEVIVTARKREEPILKVPVVETAISQQTLEQYQILSTDCSMNQLQLLARHYPARSVPSGQIIAPAGFVIDDIRGSASSCGLGMCWQSGPPFLWCKYLQCGVGIFVPYSVSPIDGEPTGGRY